MLPITTNLLKSFNPSTCPPEIGMVESDPLLVESNESDSISLKILSPTNETIIKNINVRASISSLKKMVADATGVHIAQQRLFYHGKPLSLDEKDLTFFNILNGSTIHLFPSPQAIEMNRRHVVNDQPSGNNHTLPQVYFFQCCCFVFHITFR